MNKILRFFSWPKTTLFGNQFLSKKGDSFLLEKESSANHWALKGIAGILYPILNPIAFMIKKVNQFFDKDLVVNEDLNYYKKQQRAKKEEVRSNFQKLYNTTEADDALKLYEAEEKKLIKEWDEFRKKITTPEAWNTHAEEFRKLYVKAATNFQLMLVAMKKSTDKDIETDNQVVSAENYALRITQQRCGEGSNYNTTFYELGFTDFNVTTPFGFPLNHSVFIRMYLAYRDAGSYTYKDETIFGELDNGEWGNKVESEFNFIAPTPKYLSSHAKKFYQQQPTTNNMELDKFLIYI